MLNLRFFKFKINLKSRGHKSVEKKQKNKQPPYVLSIHQQRAVKILSKIQKITFWIMLSGLLFPFFDTFFFFFWGWFWLGLYLSVEAIIDIIRREAKYFGDCDDVVYHGWSATVVSLVLLLVALSIFVIPGFVLMLKELPKIIQ